MNKTYITFQHLPSYFIDNTVALPTIDLSNWSNVSDIDNDCPDLIQDVTVNGMQSVSSRIEIIDHCEYDYFIDILLRSDVSSFAEVKEELTVVNLVDNQPYTLQFDLSQSSYNKIVYRAVMSAFNPYIEVYADVFEGDTACVINSIPTYTFQETAGLFSRPYRFFSPNTFTPNGDGINDIYSINIVSPNQDSEILACDYENEYLSHKKSSVYKYIFSVYDRWVH